GTDNLSGYGQGKCRGAPDDVATPLALGHSGALQPYIQAGDYSCVNSGATSKSSRLVTPSSSEGIGPMSSNSAEPGSPVCRGWPAETDLSVPSSGRMKLREQSQVIRDAIMASFPFLHASIVVVHAFPDALLTMTFITRALVDGISHTPNATHIRSRMLNDHVYLSKIAQLPRARISIFRAEVKERCVAAVALLVNIHDTPTLIADLIEKQLNDNYNYIFPRRSATGHILSAPPHRGQPYCSTVIISVLCDLFFTGPVPFVTQHQDLFPLSCGTKGATYREVPKPMVALIATGYYAALKEWSTGEHKHHDFTANTYLDVYKGHIQSLSQIESLKTGSYHRMMANIYRFASSTSIPALAIPSLDISILEFKD
ncbi:hypothetical protein V8E53_011724, partial [Lactarius tabidus]